MKVHLNQEEFRRVLIFIEKIRGSHHRLETLQSAKINKADFFTIWFGMRGVMGQLSMSWEFFLEQKELLDRQENQLINKKRKI